MSITKHCIKFIQSGHDTRIFAIAAANTNLLEISRTLLKPSVTVQTKFRTGSIYQREVIPFKLPPQQECSRVLKIRSSTIDSSRKNTTLAKEIEKKCLVTYEASPKILIGIPFNHKSQSSQFYRNITDDSKKISPSNKKIEDSPVTSKKEQFKKAVKDYGSVVVIFHLTLSWGSLGLLYFLISRYVYIGRIFPRIGCLCPIRYYRDSANIK